MKKGFTLVELIAVVVILGIILIIAVPKITDVINNAKINAVIKNEEMLIRATRNYLVSNNEKMPTEIGSTEEVTLEQLQTEELIQTIKSPFINGNCSGYVLITKIEDNSYDYTPHLNCVDPERGSASADGLVGYYKLDNNVLDYGINNNHGFVSGAVSDEGKINKGYYLWSGSLIIDSNEIANVIKENYYSISFWLIQGVNQLSSPWRAVLSLHDTPSTSKKWRIEHRADAYYQPSGIVDEDWFYGLQVWHNANFGYIGYNYTTPSNIWYHFVYVNDNNNRTWYINSEPQPTNYIAYDTELLTGNEFFLIGGQAVDNIIDEILIYSRILSADEIKQLYMLDLRRSK